MYVHMYIHIRILHIVHMYRCLYHLFNLLLYHVCNFRVTNITINEVDQPLISDVIEVRVFVYVCT